MNKLINLCVEYKPDISPNNEHNKGYAHEKIACVSHRINSN